MAQFRSKATHVNFLFGGSRLGPISESQLLRSVLEEETRISRILLVLTILAFTATVSMGGNVKIAAPLGSCVEDPVTGCVAQLPVGGTTMWVASDGEATFNPWGYTTDTSDQVALDSIWQQSPGSTWTFCPNCVGPAGTTQVWVLPACINGICENGNVPETVGYWDAPGYTWNFSGELYAFIMYDPDGTVSDWAKIGNFGPGGDAAFAFSSTPEPSSLLLLGSGLLGAIGVARRRFL